MRNVAREYPYSDPKVLYLWESKWSKDDVLKEMNIDDEFLANKMPMHKGNSEINFFYKLKSFCKRNFFTKKLLNLLNKYF